MTIRGVHRRFLAGAVLALLALCLAFPAPAYAQAVFGNIVGTVTDQTGAAIPNAKVTIEDVSRGASYSTTTNEAGHFTQTHLGVGAYRVTIEVPGFKKAVQTVEVKVDAVVRADTKLEVGEVTQAIEVSAEAPLLKSDRTDVSTSLDQRQVSELPIYNRNFTQLELLVPGTARSTFQHASSENPQGSIQIMVNGQAFMGTSFQLDGTDNRDPILGIIVINPILDSVVETKMTTQNYDAEFGQAMSGVMTAQTKAGTNAYHGSWFHYLRNDDANARDPFTQPKGPPPLVWNQFGGTLGGPIRKNKLFGFGDYQGTRRRTGASVLTTVPTEAVRRGDLSAFLGSVLRDTAGNPLLVQTTDGATVPAQVGMVFDPTTGNPDGTNRRAFSSAGQLNVIPPARLSQQALNLLKFFPPPNLGSGPRNNFSGSGTELFDSDQFDVRVDHYWSERLQHFGRYSYATFLKQVPGAFGNLAGGPGLAGIRFAGQSTVRNQSLAWGLNYTLRPNLLTDVRFGFYRYRVNVLPNGIGTSPAKDAGIPGLNLDNFFTSGMPAFLIDGDGSTRLGYALPINQCNCPLQQEEQQAQWVNNWTWIKGNHTLKFGGDLRYAANLRVPSDRHRSGQLTFSPDFTAAGRVGGGLGWGTFLLGQVSFFERYVSTVLDAAERQKRFFWFGQDTWRISPKLQLNVGLRWEQIFPESVTKAGAGGWLSLATGEILVGGVGGIDRQGNTQMDWRNLAPRIGLTYQATQKTVVRMAYGRSYDIGVFGSIFGHSVTQNPPVLATQQINAPNQFTAVFSLDRGPVPQAPFAVPQSGRFPLPNGIFARVRPERMTLPSVESWNLTVQHQVNPTLAAEVAYVGNVGRHMLAQSRPATNFNQAILIPGSTLNTNQRRRYFAQFGWTQNIDYFCNCSTNNYHSLQTRVEKRFSQGYSLLAHYTWSKTMDFDRDYFQYNPRLNYGVTEFDRAGVFVLTHLWELPFGRGKRFVANAGRALDLLIGGWNFNGVSTWYSGLPFSAGYSQAGADVDTGPRRPNQNGSAELDNPGRDKWFVTGFGSVWSRPGFQRFGNSRRHALRGPSVWTEDLSVFKSFSLTERFKLQFRAEAFNAFNHANLGLPVATVDAPNAGRITGLQDLRDDGSGMRAMQFALRLTF